ncbi:hypothetical protein SF1_01640 [Sphingobacterium faecium NBRC 15299]|uniref:hypothetical protein n=1 Tax=Sphingobacterium faecium TaxID=34087 RepID=UPI000D3C15F3|nr:hypothetical protein [Sphingobacterium faecium]PTX12473.1 hypothetical protein C8N37_102167 [Sphingobacterium faecium]GEM62182.1 hypothetical protein SF1_01640 [Sphingobacterium faecium NBRC 15299]
MNSYNRYLLIFISVFSVLFVKGQKIFTNKLPSSFNTYDVYKIKNYKSSELDNLLKVNLTVEQRTKKLQEYINKNSEVILPNNEIVVSKGGLNLGDNKVLIFQKNTKLRIENNDLENYGIINIIGSTNVKVLNAYIIGDRYKHYGNKGEWGHGIRIMGGKNISVENFYIENCWGDGIYIGKNKGVTSSDVNITNGVVMNSRRNGISITSIDGLRMQFVTAAFSNGTDPQFGIDFEANNSTDEMNNINLSNIVTYYNAKGGMMISFNKMASKAKVSKIINFDVTDFTDVGSKDIGLLVAQISNNFKSLNGKMTFNNINVEKNLRPIIIKKNDINSFHINLNKFNIINPTNRNFTNKEFLRVHKSKNNVNLKPGSNE